MKSYCPKGRAFLCLVWFLGLSVLIATLLLPPAPGEHFVALYVLSALLIAALAGTRKIYLLRSQNRGQSRYVTLGFLVTFATLLAIGIRAGVLAGMASAISADLYSYVAYRSDRHKRHLSFHQLLFNVASIAITAWCSGQVFVALNGSIGHIASSSLFAVVVAMSVYFILNTTLLSCVLALCAEQPFLNIWRTFLWAFPLHLTGAAFVALGLMFRREGSVVFLVGSIAPFAYQYYKMYGDHVEQKQQLIDELEAGREMLSELYLSTVKSLATAIAAKDRYTHEHIHRVQHYAVATAQQLGLHGDEMQAIRTGAILHDIGKLGVPDYVLLKPGRLSTDEFDKMKRHPVIGVDILEPVHFPWPVLSIVRNHHERWDGKGYPDGLAGEDIPMGARVLTVADVYDAVTSDRPYRPAWSHEKAIAFLIAEAGKQFDPKIVDAFVQIVEESTATLRALPIEEKDIQADGTSAAVAESDPVSSASQQIGRTASELWVLYEVSQTLNSSAPIQERLKLLGHKLTSILPGTTCAFLLCDPLDNSEGHTSKAGDAFVTDPDRSAEPGTAKQVADSQVTRAPGSLFPMRLAAAAGVNADILYADPASVTQSACVLSIQVGNTYRGSYHEEEMTRSVSLPDRPVRSLLILPLAYAGERLGTMTFYHRDANAFTSDDEQLLSMIAEQVQTAVYQDREHDRTRSDANTDALTGLHNMRYLRHRTNALMREYSLLDRAAFALLYLDLDNFKNVNTLYGHPMGSRVLTEVAQLLPRELRPTDLAVRYGGDEFVIVLPQTPEEGAREVATRIRAAIKRYHPAFLPEFASSCHLDASIGIAFYPQDGTTMEALVALADQRMYTVKSAQKVQSGMQSPPVCAPAPICLDTAVVASILQEWSVIGS